MEHIRQIIEESDPEGKIPQAVMEEIIAAVESFKDLPQLGMGNSSGEQEVENALKKQLREEGDWRDKVVAAAKLISLGLDK